MSKVYDRLDDKLMAFIGRQHLLFVGTAPDAPDGHLNLSPKGLDTFRVLGPTSVAYLDLTGSGVETIAHLRENGRIAILFCAFEGRPLIVRLHGRGRVVEPGEPEWDGLIAGFPDYPGVRSVIVVELERIADSCGFAVPLYEFKGERTQLVDYATKKGPEALEKYRSQKNKASIDGLAGLRSAGGASMDEPGRPPIRVEEAEGEGALDRVRRLLEQGAAEMGPLIAEILAAQGFAAEVAGLPGRYAPPSGCLLLATVADAPAGCVALRDLGGGTCEMKRLYVAPALRGRGVARRLVDELLRRAVRLGYRRMVLDTLPEMAPAIALYQQAGFVATAPYWGHPDGHAVFMEKALGDATDGP